MCDNPWLESGKICTRKDLAVFIVNKGIQKSICHPCWKKIADMDIEWGEDPKPESITEMHAKEREIEKKATLTEYKSRG